jgi:RNA polymerase sigma factor (sigma-70 family)
MRGVRLAYVVPSAVTTTDRSVVDREALDLFCRTEHPKIVGFLTLFCGDRDLATELAQETMIRVVQHWKKVRRMDAPTAWTHRVAVNLASSWFRRAVRGRRVMQRLHEPETRFDPDTADVVAVRKAVAALPPRQRAAIVLRYYADLPADDVAMVMGCKTGTVWALTNQGLESLRRAGLTDLAEVSDE